MRTLTTSDFQKMCEEISPAVFTFCTEDNKSGSYGDKIEGWSKYTDVVFDSLTSRVLFKNECGVICFNKVKKIFYHDEEDPLVGMVFEIICGNPDTDSDDVSSIILASKNFLKN